MGRVDAAADALERFFAGDGGRIDVGTFQSVSAVLLPAIVARLRAEQPDLDIRLFEDEHKEEGCRKVLDGELDVTFCVGQRSGDLESLVLLDDPFVLVARRGELTAERYPTRQLDGVALVAYPPGPCQQEIEDGLRSIGAQPTYVFRTNDNGAQIAMVRAGMGWAVMPMLAVEAADPTIDVRPLHPAITPRQVCLVWRRDRTLSPVATRLIAIAAEVAAEIGHLPASA